MAKDELRLIEDALIEEILRASPEETIADLREQGFALGDAEALLDRMAVEALGAAKGQRLAAAKERAATFRSTTVERSTPVARAAVQSRLRALRDGSPAPGMMLAARKGDGMSEGDEDSLAEDLADLDRLRSAESGR